MFYKKTKVLLVVAPFVDLKLPLIGLPYLSSFLKQNNYEVKIYDLNIKLKSVSQNYKFDTYEEQVKFFYDNIEYFKKWIQEVLSFNPHIIGFTMWNTNCHIIKKLSSLIKEYDKNIYIVCGGAYISENYDTEFELEKILSLDSINCLIMGEGENTLLDVVNSVESDKYPIDIIGTISIDLNNKIKINPFREEEKNIDVLPFPDYSYYNLENYLLKNAIPLIFSRGCKGRCKFCTVFAHWKKFRTRSALNVFNEILFRIKEYNMNKYEFELHDCACNQDLNMLEQLCDLLLNDSRTKNKVFFSSFAKIIDMDYKLLTKMRQVGFKNLKFGLESGSNKILKLMCKPHSVEKAKTVIKNTWLVGIEAVVMLIIGFPGETEEDFDKTIQFVEDNFKYITEIHLNLYCMNEVLINNFSNILDMDNKDIYKWSLKDMSNTYEIRKNRLKKIDKALMSKFKNIKREGMCYTNIDNKKV